MKRLLVKLLLKLRIAFFPTAHDREFARWVADRGDEELRMNYPLTNDSLVIDLGGYRGQWASDIFARYACKIIIFEPVVSFATKIRERFRHNPRITIHALALGGSRRREDLFLSADGTSFFRTAGEKESIQVEDVADFFHQNIRESVALMKINIEGGEYELLERLLATGLVTRVQNLQIQFHNIAPDSAARARAIGERLAQTHRRTYYYPFLWENWQRHLT